jgi:hypothetical protein
MDHFAGHRSVSAVGKRNFPGQRQRPRNGPRNSNGQSAETKCVHESPPRSWPGNAIFQGRDKDPETAPCNSLGGLQRQNACRIAASSGLFALNQEISVCAGLRGGPERTRTACQPRSRYRTDLRPVANWLV